MSTFLQVKTATDFADLAASVSDGMRFLCRIPLWRLTLKIRGPMNTSIFPMCHYTKNKGWLKKSWEQQILFPLNRFNKYNSIPNKQAHTFTIMSVLTIHTSDKTLSKRDQASLEVTVMWSRLTTAACHAESGMAEILPCSCLMVGCRCSPLDMAL